MTGASNNHYVKTVRIRSYSGPSFPAFELNTVPIRENMDQNNSEYGDLSLSVQFDFKVAKI